MGFEQKNPLLAEHRRIVIRPASSMWRWQVRIIAVIVGLMIVSVIHDRAPKPPTWSEVLQPSNGQLLIGHSSEVATFTPPNVSGTTFTITAGSGISIHSDGVWVISTGS